METPRHTEHESVDENLADPEDNAATSDEETRGKGDNGALWLLAGVVALAGGTLWMIRDVWTAKPVATESVQMESAAGHARSAPAPMAGTLPSAAEEDSEQVYPERDAALPGEESDIDQRRRQKGERLTELKLEAERMERERLAAEEELEAERAAREALERERREAEDRLARERAARQALEQERRQAEQKLARERAARAELERKARLEKKRLLQAKQAAEQASLDRARAEAELADANARAAAEAQAAELAAQATPEPVVVQTTADDRESSQQQGTGSGSFSSNPCEGPSARFLSTCR